MRMGEVRAHSLGKLTAAGQGRTRFAAWPCWLTVQWWCVPNILAGN